MAKKYKGFEPKWFNEKFSDLSYRSIFKWGDYKQIKPPKERMYKMLKEAFNLTDDNFKNFTENLGTDEVKIKNHPIKLAKKHIEYFKKVLGEEYVKTDDYSRVSVAYGKTMYDVMRLRNKRLDNLPDVVLYPSESKEIEEIVKYCNENKIPLYVYGGGSSVTRGVECILGGVSLDMRKRFNKVISFNEIDQTITVQAGMSGPKYEEILNNAIKELNAKRAYTGGHFPQSFEYSSVGGWVVTRGAGQNSTYYGKIEDIVLSQKYVTPIGNVTTSHYPREATGPSLNQMMMGSEGSFGVLVEVTLRIFRFMPENRKRFSYMFKSWDVAMEAAREMMQSECGFSSVFRLSDQYETEYMMELYGINDSPLAKYLSIKGCESGKECLFLGFTDGEKGYSKNVYKNIKKIAKKYKAVSLTSYVCKSWEHGRFSDPFLRDTLQDYGVVIDTMECSVNWSNMEQVHKDVRKVCVSRPHTICITHMSHVYPQGANLYFIFICKMSDPEEFKSYHASILDAIQKSGAAMSHHHGIGKMFGPWLEAYIGETEYGTFKVLKNYFDPNNIMNPGGTLGLDTKEKDKHKFIDHEKMYYK